MITSLNKFLCRFNFLLVTEKLNCWAKQSNDSFFFLFLTKSLVRSKNKLFRPRWLTYQFYTRSVRLDYVSMDKLTFRNEINHLYTSCFINRYFAFWKTWPKNVYEALSNLTNAMHFEKKAKFKKRNRFIS